MRSFGRFRVALISILACASAYGEAETLEALKAAAAGGAGEDQLAVALAYDEGKLVPRNTRLAAEWYQKAAEQGIGVADLQLGYFAETGQGMTQDFEEARAYYDRAIAEGCTAAGLRLGLMNIEGWGGPRDLSEAARLIGAAAESGDPIAERVYGSMYFSGFAVERDLSKALEWEEKAAKTDSPEAEIGLGNFLQRIHARDQDASIARTWYELSASQDYSRGMRAMADSFLRQGSSPETVSLGRHWLELASEARDAQAELRLAILYARYPGYHRQPELLEKGKKLLEQAGKQGVSAAGQAVQLMNEGRSFTEAVRYLVTVPSDQRLMKLQADRVTRAGPDRNGQIAPILIRVVRARYPASLLLTRTDGKAVVAYTVDTKGHVTQARAVMATHPGFAESAVEAVKRWEFIPASQGGQPVEATRRWTVHFFAPVGEVNLKQADDVAHQTQPLIEVAAAGSFDAKLKLTESLDNAEDLMWEGQMEQAILELDLAIAAAPKSGLAYLMRGKAEMSLGKMNEAAADINSAIPLNPKAEGPIISRGVWNQSMGNLEAALADYDRSLKMISGDSNRAWVLRSLVLRKLNRTEAADALASQRAKWGNSWASELADYLLGQITEDELLQRAGEGGPDLAPGRLTEAHYYVGVDLLLKHDPQLARQHFETCLSLNQSNYAEWPLATAELAALR